MDEDAGYVPVATVRSDGATEWRCTACGSRVMAAWELLACLCPVCGRDAMVPNEPAADRSFMTPVEESR